MLVIGLTGGIASGKSTVASLLSSPPHNIPLIDADVIARRVLDPGTSAHAKVLSHFGASVLLDPSAGSRSGIDRAALGARVFASEPDRRVLNSIVHPAVRKAMALALLKHWLLLGSPIVVVDVPLLIETGLWKLVGRTVVVFVAEQLQLKRLLDRPPIPPSPPLTPQQARDRIASQLPLRDKLPYADHVIDNSSDQRALGEEVSRLVASWKMEQGRGWWVWLCRFCPPVGVLSALWTVWGHRSKIGRRLKRGKRGRGENSRVAGIRLEEIELEVRDGEGRRR